jgi:hypothetical protein
MKMTIEIDASQQITICKALSYGAGAIGRLPNIDNQMQKDMENMASLLTALAGDEAVQGYINYVDSRLGPPKVVNLRSPSK